MSSFEEHFETRRSKLQWAVIFGGMTAITLIVMLFVPPIAQDNGYHSFADDRSFLGVPNFLNVASNIGFMVVGVVGILFLFEEFKSVKLSELQHSLPYCVFFAGIFGTALGSAYYHLSPGNQRLMWDRLPMSIAFMSLVAAAIGDRFGKELGLLLLVPLIGVGAGSVLYWRMGELNGSGDLRPYGLVQFCSMLFLIVLALFAVRNGDRRVLLLIVGTYGVAKIFESFDAKIYSLGQIISGHTLKHLTAAIASYWVLQMLKRQSYGCQV